MKAYSRYDLLGIEIEAAKLLKLDLVTRFLDWFDSRSNTGWFTIEVPVFVYEKTDTICEEINTKLRDFELNFYASKLIANIYIHFLRESFSNKTGLNNACNILKQNNFYHTPLIISNPSKNEIVSFDSPYKPLMHKEIMKIPKKWIKKGETLLHEIECEFGLHFTVEVLISSLWINFVNESKAKSKKAIINDLADMFESI